MNTLSSVHNHGFHNIILSLPTLTGTYLKITISGYTNAYRFTGGGTILLPILKSVQILLVAGGADGGSGTGFSNYGGGGGGAGAVGAGSVTLNASTEYTVVVGSRGLFNGGNTTVSGTGVYLNVVGGGAGGDISINGRGLDGGSSGGGSGVDAPGALISNTNTTTNTKSITFYAHLGAGPSTNSGGGGGGAGTAGSVGATGGKGGNGYTWNGTVYAGGGGGGSSTSTTGGTGGTGGGGNGGNNQPPTAGNGKNATGYGSGGGGAGGDGSAIKGLGTSGCVIFAWN